MSCPIWKSLIAFAAIIPLGTIALSPSSAFAGGHGGFGGHGFGGHGFGLGSAASGSGTTVTLTGSGSWQFTDQQLQRWQWTNNPRAYHQSAIFQRHVAITGMTVRNASE
jgi:hypothetical protein